MISIQNDNHRNSQQKENVEETTTIRSIVEFDTETRPTRPFVDSIHLTLDLKTKQQTFYLWNCGFSQGTTGRID